MKLKQNIIRTDWDGTVIVVIVIHYDNVTM